MDAGRYDILIGASSADIRVVIPVTVSAPSSRDSVLTDMSPLQDWLADAIGRIETIELLRTLAPIIGEVFGHDPEHPDAHSNSYFGQMPIRDVLEFAAASGGPDPDERIDDLLRSLAKGQTAVGADDRGDPVTA